MYIVPPDTTYRPPQRSPKKITICTPCDREFRQTRRQDLRAKCAHENTRMLRAFVVAAFVVLCPVCSFEQKVPRSPRLIDQNGDWIFRCNDCTQQFLYNPFVDKTSEERALEVESLRLARVENEEIVNSAMLTSMGVIR